MFATRLYRRISDDRRKPLARYGAMESALRERLAPEVLHHQLGHDRGGHVGRSPSLVDEDESPGIEGLLHLAPSGARGRDIRPLLLGRVQGFF